MGDHENSDLSTDDTTSVGFGAHEDHASDLEASLDKDMWSSLNELASRLCYNCREFLRGGEKAAARRTYHPSLSSLQRSVDTGCSICKQLSQSLDEFCAKVPPPSSPTDTCSIQCQMRENNWFHRDGDTLPLKNGFTLSFELQEGDCPYFVKNSHEIHAFANLQFYSVKGFGLGPEFLDPELERSTAKSAASMNLARQWYQQCLYHSTCRNWKHRCRRIPTRLIRVRRPDSNYPDIISAQLCETEELPLDIVYATLSHSWGDDRIFQLRQSNIEILKQSIPFRQLPQVFQDAIYVCLELGVNYLWIDSLCIIQDSKEDWTHEAKRMGDVYQYATCNIAAAGYEDSSLSLFRERKSLSQTHPIALADCTVQTEKGETILFNGFYILADGFAFYTDIFHSILNSRAWVCQERALSPGILHFTPKMIWWECNDLVANEVFPKGYIWEDASNFQTCTIRRLAQESEPESIYEFWRKFFGDYAGKALTYEQDRFPAAVGIARILSELIDDNFIAGFWEGDLIRSLIMCCHVRAEDLPSTPRAPSWSWASLRTLYRDLLVRDPASVRPLRGVGITVLSDVPAFKSDLESTSLEVSDVRGLEITAPLRKMPPDLVDGVESVSEWLQSAFIYYDIDRSDEFSWGQVPINEAWRMSDPTHFLVLAKEDVNYDDSGITRTWGLAVQQCLEAEGSNIFRKQGLVHLFFRTDEKMEEYLGLKEDKRQYVLSPVLEECGFQKIILI